MIPDFSKDDITVVSHHIGKIFIAFGMVQIIPIFIGLICGEISAVIDFFISIIACFAFASILLYFSPYLQEINWRQGMIIVSLSWLLAMFFSALPLFLSGHYGCYLDACFESMSAYATTGLVEVAYKRCKTSTQIPVGGTLRIEREGVVTIVTRLNDSAFHVESGVCAA
ncbi:MAG TPA: hypothetical protein PKK91_08840 [bacterium]|nr:hypothetical protein [bacterium]